MKFISWNVNGIRACVKKGFLDFFNETDADIFCIQESKMQEGQLDLNLPGYHQYWNYAVKKGYSGTGIFTKEEPISVFYGLGIEEHDQEGRVITLEFKDYYFITVYTPNSQNGLARLDYRMKWEDDFRTYLKKLEETKPVIVTGDMNVAHKEIDLKNPKTNRKNAGFTDEERQKFTELLDAGFSEMKVGLIPAGTDQVVVGDMERSRLKDVKVLFFAGVNEGSVPREKSRGGLLSEMDRERLAEQEVELAPTSRQETCIQKFYMYLNLTKPSQRLILSWSLADADGKSLRPSWLIASIKELFPKVDIRTEADRTLTGLLALPEGSLTELTEAVQAAREQKETRLQQALIRWYAEHKEWQQKLDRLLDAVFYVKKEQPIGHAVARALYGTLLEGSVTRLEQFAACAYAHFLQYGLRLRERELSGLQAVDMGNVFHDALKYFSDTVSGSEYDWLHVPNEKRDSWMEESLERALEKYAERGLDTDAQDAYAVERMKRIGKRTAWAVMEQLKKGMFVPERTEVSFRNLEQLSSVSVLLSEDERMRLQGRIDRIDVCRQDGNVYVRVIDYKSGMTKFDLTSVYYGLQLQLAVYLNAAMEMEQRDSTGEVHPAGMFYYHIQDPMLDYEEESDPVLRILKELALNGIVNADPQIVNLMDRESGGGSSVLPVKFKKDGGYTASSSVAEETQLQRLSRHVSRKRSV